MKREYHTWITVAYNCIYFNSASSSYIVTRNLSKVFHPWLVTKLVLV